MSLLDRELYINAVFRVGDYEFSTGHIASYFPNDLYIRLKSKNSFSESEIDNLARLTSEKSNYNYGVVVDKDIVIHVDQIPVSSHEIGDFVNYQAFEDFACNRFLDIIKDITRILALEQNIEIKIFELI